jgi:hypothetical protein
VRGTRLVIDMLSGESIIDTAPGTTSSSPSGGGWLTEAPPGGDAPVPENTGRASAVFFPQQLKDDAGAKKGAKQAEKPKPEQPGPEGWGITSTPGQ